MHAVILFTFPHILGRDSCPFVLLKEIPLVMTSVLQYFPVIPNMDFVASDKHIFAGDSVEFACTVSMLEPKFPTIKLVSGRNLDLSSHEKEESIINGHTVATDVWLYKQEGLKQDYVCEVECYCGEKFMEMLQKNVTIYSYGMYYVQNKRQLFCSFIAVLKRTI